MLDVLFVDADEATRRAFAAFLRQSGLGVEADGNAFAALRRLERAPVHVVVTEQILPGPSGTMFLETVRRRWPKTGRVLFTRAEGFERQVLAVGALLIRKGSRPEDVRRAIIAEVQDAERRHESPAR